MQNLPVYSVTELNHKVRITLESEIATVGVTGEISNLVKASSGHFYFTLKDSKAQIRCAFFNAQFQKLMISKLENGVQILAYGKISLYEPRGDYQLIVTHIQESGLGLLYQQFVELKNKLEKEGLFDANLKKPIPPYPTQIAIVTSPIGAALHDILTTIQRRYPLARTELYPTEVQGIDAPKQIMSALIKAQEDKRNDVIILGRGGGSLEDLWAFNHEQLAYTILECDIPIITGIGHETDFTIADFVADYRAATPTAAAEKATPNQIELLQKIDAWQKRLLQCMTHKINQYQQTIYWFSKQFIAPEKLFSQTWQKLDFSTKQLKDTTHYYFSKRQQQVLSLTQRLQALSPKQQLQVKKEKYHPIDKRFHQLIEHYFQNKTQQLSHLTTQLAAIGPKATLARGYAIASYQNKILSNSTQVSVNDTIEIQLFKGKIETVVKEIQHE
jgi:exodeoxyribonuclease VII large subunit